MIALFALLFAGLTPQQAIPTHAEHLAAIAARCNIPAARLTVEVDPGITPADSYATLLVHGAAKLSDRQLRCYGDALAKIIEGPSLYPSFEDETLGARYSEIVRKDTLAYARKMLSARGLLRRLPLYNPNRETLADFAVRLEKLCGAKPGSALKVTDDWMGLSDTTPDEQLNTDPNAAFCAIHAAMASGHNPFEPPPIPVTTID